MSDLPTTAQRLADAENGYPDAIADYIGQHCPIEFPEGADKAAELIMAELIRPLLAEREQARRIAVALEQENAHLTEQVQRVRDWATSHEYRWLHELLDGNGTHGGAPVTAPTLFDTEAPAAATAAEPRLYTIELPAGLDLLNANQRLHHAPKAKLTAKIRAAAMEAVAENDDLMRALAKAKPGPLFQRAHILGILRPSTYGRRRDAANWYPSFKAAVDGIVDAGVLDDDDHEHVVGPDMRLGPKARGGQLVLVVSALGPGEDPLDVALGGCQWPDREQVTR